MKISQETQTVKRTVDLDKLLQEMAEVMAQWDGESIERIANQVFTQRVTYIEDSTFEVEDSEER